jgi:hypothetical protein
MEKLLSRLWIASTAAVNIHERLPASSGGVRHVPVIVDDRNFHGSLIV